MARDMADTNLRYVLLGHVNEVGKVNLRFPVRRFPKTYREKEFYRLPFLNKRESLPGGFEIRSFLTEHFLKGSQYVEELFAVPSVSLDPMMVLTKIESRQR